MDLESNWPLGYRLVQGSSVDRSRLISTLGSAYEELGATQLGHLAKTVELYLEGPSMLWWLEKTSTSRVGFTAVQAEAVGCLWLGQSINQLTGALQAYIYLVYVAPQYRRRGMGRKLMQHAKDWAAKQGYDQISLQVFVGNFPAIKLYRQEGYQTQAIWMTLNL